VGCPRPITPKTDGVCSQRNQAIQAYIHSSATCLVRISRYWSSTEPDFLSRIQGTRFTLRGKPLRRPASGSWGGVNDSKNQINETKHANSPKTSPISPTSGTTLQHQIQVVPNIGEASRLILGVPFAPPVYGYQFLGTRERGSLCIDRRILSEEVKLK